MFRDQLSLVNNRTLMFQRVYLQIIREQVAPNAFTPEPLLNDIVSKCFWNFGDVGTMQIYPLKDIIQMSGDQLKNKHKFEHIMNKVKDCTDFAISVVYLKNNSMQTYRAVVQNYCNGYMYADSIKLKQQKLYFAFEETIKYLSNVFFETTLKGINLHAFPKYPWRGCLIVINGQVVKTRRDFEQVFDHQLNHYFDKVGFLDDFGVQYCLPKIEQTKSISQLLNRYYNFSGDKNFQCNVKMHLYNDDEFYSMCATTFHIILKYKQKYRTTITKQSFLSMIDYDFINSDQFMNREILNDDLRDAIMFCYVNKQLAPDRFKIILKGVQAAFKIQKNIFKKFLIKTKDLIRSILC